MNLQVKLLLWTAVLSAVIWTYADQASHENYTAASVPIQIVPPPDPNAPYALRVAGAAAASSPDLIRAALTFRGPRSRILKLKQEEQQNRFRLAIKLQGELKTNERQSIELAPLLEQLPDIVSRGLKLQGVSPVRVEFDVQRYRRVPVELRPLAGAFEKELTALPKFDVEKVIAQVLQTSLGPDGTLPPLQVPIEDAIEKELAKRPIEGSGTLSFEVTLISSWPGIEATFTPARVLATVSLERRPVKYKIERIPLRIVVSAARMMGDYDAQLDDEGDLLQQIEVQVPQAKLEQVKQLESNQILAVIALDETDFPAEPIAAGAEGTRLEKRVRFVLPQGFEDVAISSPPRMVKLHVRRKAVSARGITPPAILPAPP